jgi:ABC-type phosphate transport system substrate-binding protein
LVDRVTFTICGHDGQAGVGDAIAGQLQGRELADFFELGQTGVGYGGAAYGKGIRELKIKKDAGSTGYAPTAENIKSGVYPISRFLFLYVRNKPTGALKEYIDWILSNDGQAIVAEVGYFPIR